VDFAGSCAIDADVATIWEAILNAEILRECIPGCQSMTGSPEDGFEAIVKQKIGPISMTFKGTIRVSDMVAHRSLTLSGEGSGGIAGFAKGDANVLIDAQGNLTTLQYRVHSEIGGKIAQLGNRMIEGFASRFANQFFSNFQNAVNSIVSPG